MYRFSTLKTSNEMKENKWRIDMTVSEYTRLIAKIAVLKEVAEEYPGKTIENIIAQLEARRKEVENAH